jgi:hypothetical protein
MQHLSSLALSVAAIGSFAPASWNDDRDDLVAYGYTTANKLIQFEDDWPERAWTIGTVSGLMGDTALVGIDFRPATGELYGLGNAGGIYTLDKYNAAATLHSQLSIALSGASFGIDFNPVFGSLRVVGDDGQNLRVDADTGAATADPSLNYLGAVAGGVTGVAFTNNDSDANTETTRFEIDTLLDQVAIQAPRNSGSLTATGKLRLDTGQDVGFDIYSRVRYGTTVENMALAALRVGGQSMLYRIDLLTGRPSCRGSFSSDHQIIGLAIALDQ